MAYPARRHRGPAHHLLLRSDLQAQMAQHQLIDPGRALVGRAQCSPRELRWRLLRVLLRPQEHLGLQQLLRPAQERLRLERLLVGQPLLDQLPQHDPRPDDVNPAGN